MKETSTKALLAIIAGGVTAYFGAVAVPLAVLIVAMAIDYCTGMTKAYVTGELSSHTGVMGIIKKVGYLTVVCVAAIVDWLLMGAYMSDNAYIVTRANSNTLMITVTFGGETYAVCYGMAIKEE
jgi:toxin secretion/phage lysis holin